MAERFSELFNLGLDQGHLEFVDIPLNTDVPLFVDPYSFKVGSDDWSIECNNLVVEFFQSVLDCIRGKRDFRGRSLLNNLGEPNETRLGLSAGLPQGRGLGASKASDLYQKLSGSEAATTGFLKDLSDCELMIPGISFDTISDVTINVIRGKLIAFTQEQCKLHSIPMAQVAAGMVWNASECRWQSQYAKLPVYNGGKLLLVPKTSVRYTLAVNHQQYYHHFVLNYLQQEHLNSNSSLVEVLQSGKRRVTKKSLKEQNPCTKDFLYEFSKDHPNVLERYHKSLLSGSSQPDDQTIEDIINERLGRPSVSINNVSITMNADEINHVQGDIIGGVVGSGTINARDITAFKGYLSKSSIPHDAITALIQARQLLDSSDLSTGDKADVSDDLGKLTKELEQESPEPARIRTLFGRIKEVAPFIGPTLMAIKLVADLVMGTPPTPSP